MALDGIFISKLSEELNNKLSYGRVDRIDGINKTDFVFYIRKPGITYPLFLSISYNNPSIFISPTKMEKPETPSSFTMFLRKRLEGSFLKEIYQYNSDRIIMIKFDRKDDLEGLLEYTLVLELIGRFSNLLLLDEKGNIIEAIKQLSVLETSSRAIMKGLKYEAPLNEKIPSYEYDLIEKRFMNLDDIYENNLVSSISGISPIIAKYIINEFKSNKLSFIDNYKTIINKYDPVLSNNDYYFFNIFNKDVKHLDDLSNVLYQYYKTNIEEKTLKENNSKIYQVVSSNIKRLEKKIIKLETELEKDKNSDIYKLYGELLLANIHMNHPRENTIKVLNYYTNEYIDIPIDSVKSIKDNSNQYYKKYKKSKVAISHIEEQLTISKKELDYFKLISYQLKQASLKDILEIRNELILNGYLKNKVPVNKKKIKPNFETHIINDTKIYVGHNNIQNDYLTHTLANRDDLWFHIKDGHGSHVIVSGDNKYNEEIIRKAAELAAIHSEAKLSSNIPVDYTQVKYIKKVPGTKGSFVTYTNHKTIYININN